jgi:hypothetical protein
MTTRRSGPRGSSHRRPGDDNPRFSAVWPQLSAGERALAVARLARETFGQADPVPFGMPLAL